MFKTKYRITLDSSPSLGGPYYIVYRKRGFFGFWHYVSGYVKTLKEAEEIIKQDQFVKYVEV